jgi:hypothetical protein
VQGATYAHHNPTSSPIKTALLCLPHRGLIKPGRLDHRKGSCRHGAIHPEAARAGAIYTNHGGGQSYPCTRRQPEEGKLLLRAKARAPSHRNGARTDFTERWLFDLHRAQAYKAAVTTRRPPTPAAGLPYQRHPADERRPARARGVLQPCSPSSSTPLAPPPAEGCVWRRRRQPCASAWRHTHASRRRHGSRDTVDSVHTDPRRRHLHLHRRLRLS